jgi:hypothetical protein
LKSGVYRLKINRRILDKVRMHKHTYEAYKDITNVEIKLLQLCLRLQDREAEDASKDRTFAEAYNSTSQEYSPRPRGENLLRQLYTNDGLQHGIQHSKLGLPTDGCQWHHQKREKEKIYTQ